jgi:TPR repeat protein
LNTNEIDSIAISSKQENHSTKKDFSIVVDELYGFISKIINKGDWKLQNQQVIEYFGNHNINSQEFYDFLLNNQISTNSIFILGYFNYRGIVTSENNEKAYELFIKASEKNHLLAQLFVGYCYFYGYGTTKNQEFAFKYYEKMANENMPDGIMMLGYCYDEGIGTKIDKQKAFELYQNTANLGHLAAQNNLAVMYEKGYGITKNINKAIYWYEKSAKQGYESAKNNLKRLQNNQ